MDVLNSEYAGFLEEIIENIVKYQPTSIAVQFITKDGNVGSGYYQCSPNDKAMMSATMQIDATMDAIESNPEWLRGILEQDDGDS